MSVDPLGSVGAVIGIVQLARSVYKSCKACVGEYQTLSSDTKELASILQDLEDLADSPQLDPTTKQEIIERSQGCRDVLVQLQTHLAGFNRLPTQNRRAFDRLRWDQQEARDLGAKINNKVTLLTAFYTKLNNSALRRIEWALGQLLFEYQAGHRDATSIASLTHNKDESNEDAWTEFTRHLEDVGITEEIAAENRPFIVNWFIEAKNEGLIQEGDPSTGSEVSAPTSDPKESTDKDTVTTEDLPTSPKDSLSPIPSGGLQYMEAFPEIASEVEKEVRNSRRYDYKDYRNLAREFWGRGNWFKARDNLLRLLVAVQLLPQHRKYDLDARTIAFLLAIVCSYSGDLQKAKILCLSILQPFSKAIDLSKDGGTSEYESPSDDGHIAVAIWLADLCLKTNQLEDAALAYSLAIGASRQWDISARLEQPRIDPQASGRLQQPTSDSAPRHSLGGPVQRIVSRAATRDSLCTQILAAEIASINSHLHNFDELLDMVGSDWYPTSDSIFAGTDILSTPQMTYLVRQALPMPSRSRSMPLPNRRSSGASPGGEDFKSRKHHMAQLAASNTAPVQDWAKDRFVAAHDRLETHNNHTGWPMPYDPDFSCAAALHAIDWFHSFTQVPGEGATFNVPSWSWAASRAFGRPDHVTSLENLELARYVANVRRALEALGVQYKEAPAEFKCRPLHDRPTDWAAVAVFAVRVVKFRVSAVRSRHGLYFTSILHWDGSTLQRAVPVSKSGNLLRALEVKLRLYESEARGDLLAGHA